MPVAIRRPKVAAAPSEKAADNLLARPVHQDADVADAAAHVAKLKAALRQAEQAAADPPEPDPAEVAKALDAGEPIPSIEFRRREAAGQVRLLRDRLLAAEGRERATVATAAAERIEAARPDVGALAGQILSLLRAIDEVLAAHECWQAKMLGLGVPFEMLQSGLPAIGPVFLGRITDRPQLAHALADYRSRLQTARIEFDD